MPRPTTSLGDSSKERLGERGREREREEEREREKGSDKCVCDYQVKDKTRESRK